MLIDTSGLLCLHYPTEPLHSLACTAYKRATVKLTHSYIIAEYVALANARRFPRSSILTFVIDLLDNPDIEMVWINESLYRKAIDLLMIRQDKSYSLYLYLSIVLDNVNVGFRSSTQPTRSAIPTERFAIALLLIKNYLILWKN